MTKLLVSPKQNRKSIYAIGLIACLVVFLFGGIALLVGGMSNPQIVTYALVAYLPFSKHLAGDFV